MSGSLTRLDLLAIIAIISLITAGTATASMSASGYQSNLMTKENMVTQVDSSSVEILNFQPEEGDYQVGDTVAADVEVRNTGKTDQDFFLGYGVQGPDGDWYDNNRQTGYVISLDAGERDWFTVTWTVEESAPTGEYNAKTSVWEETDRDNLNTRLANEEQSDVFEVTESQDPVAQITCQSDIQTHEDFSCDAYDSSDPDGNIVEYQWKFQDDTKYGEIVDYSSDEGGYWTIELTVTDDDGNTDYEDKSISIEDSNSAPSAEIDCDTSAQVGEEIDCDAFETTDTDDNLEDYDWNFGDGTSDSGESVSHTYDDPGTYYVDLTVTDTEGASDSASQQVTIEPEPNEPPTAEINCERREYTVGEQIDCTSDGSADPDGSLSEYAWRVNGDIVYSSNLDKSFDAAGEYPVTLVVTDDDGLSDSDSMTLSISEPSPPNADISCEPQTVLSDERVSCTASGSTDADGDITNIEWEFGGEASGSGMSKSHSFSSPGEYTVYLEVVDATGLSDTARTTVHVERPNQKPTVGFDVSSNTPEVGESITFDAGDSIDPDGEVVEYQWSFPGGETKYGEQVSHTFDRTGKYTIELTVSDNTGAERTAQQTMSVLSRPDAAFEFGPKKPKPGHDVTFRAETDGDIREYRWDFDNDGNIDQEGSRVSHRFDSNGRHSVTLEVVDRNGVENQIDQVVHVQQNAYFDLTSNRINIEPGGEAIVLFEISNNVKDESLTSKLELNLPNGAQITSVTGDRIESPTSTEFVTVPPGEKRSIRVRIQFNDAGTFPVTGNSVYYFGDQEDRRESDVGPIEVSAQDGNTPATDGSGSTGDTTSQSAPGFSILTVSGALLTLLCWWRVRL